MVAVASVLSASSRAVTVTVRAVFQVVVLKVSASVTATTPPAPASGVTVTSLAGSVSSTTV